MTRQNLPGARWRHDGKGHKAADDHHTVRYPHSVLSSLLEAAANQTNTNPTVHYEVTTSIINKMWMTNNGKDCTKMHSHACMRVQTHAHHFYGHFLGKPALPSYPWFLSPLVWKKTFGGDWCRVFHVRCPSHHTTQSVRAQKGTAEQWLTAKMPLRNRCSLTNS